MVDDVLERPSVKSKLFESEEAAVRREAMTFEAKKTRLRNSPDLHKETRTGGGDYRIYEYVPDKNPGNPTPGDYHTGFPKGKADQPTEVKVPGDTSMHPLVIENNAAKKVVDALGEKEPIIAIDNLNWVSSGDSTKSPTVPHIVRIGVGDLFSEKRVVVTKKRKVSKKSRVLGVFHTESRVRQTKEPVIDRSKPKKVPLSFPLDADQQRVFREQLHADLDRGGSGLPSFARTELDPKTGHMRIVGLIPKEEAYKALKPIADSIKPPDDTSFEPMAVDSGFQDLARALQSIPSKE